MRLGARWVGGWWVMASCQTAAAHSCVSLLLMHPNSSGAPLAGAGASGPAHAVSAGQRCAVWSAQLLPACQQSWLPRPLCPNLPAPLAGLRGVEVTHAGREEGHRQPRRQQEGAAADREEAAAGDAQLCTTTSGGGSRRSRRRSRRSSSRDGLQRTISWQTGSSSQQQGQGSGIRPEGSRCSQTGYCRQQVKRSTVENG